MILLILLVADPGNPHQSTTTTGFNWLVVFVPVVAAVLAAVVGALVRHLLRARKPQD